MYRNVTTFKFICISKISCQIEVTEEFSGAKTLTSSLNEDEGLDMQKGEKAHDLRKLSESGKLIAKNIYHSQISSVENNWLIHDNIRNWYLRNSLTDFN